MAVAAPALPFTLADLGPALIANWDARLPASLSRTGAAVAAWADQVAGLSLAQATATARPTYGATGWDGALPAVTFDGASSAGNGDILTMTTALADRYWIFALLERAAADQNNGAGSTMKTIMSVSRNSDGLYSQFGFLRPNSDSGQTALRVSAWGDGANIVAAAGGMAKGTKGLVFVDAGRTIRNNAGAGATIVGSGAGTRTEFSLGGSLSHDHNRTMMKVAQIVIVDPTRLKGDGADNQRWVIEGLLAHAWGIAGLLPDLHPFRPAPPLRADWTGNAREIFTWGNSLTLGFSPHIQTAWASSLSLPPITAGGVGGETSTQIRVRFDAAPARSRKCVNVIGEMFENSSGDGNPSTRTHVDHMAAAVLAAGGRAIILDRHIDNLPGFAYGGAARIAAEAENAYLASAYPDGFLNVSEFVRSLGAPGALYDDPSQYALGLPPSAAMADNVHWTGAVYQMVGAYIGNAIKAKGWDR